MLAKRDKARLALNLALTSAAEKSLRWQGARFYTQKYKVGLELANKLTPKYRMISIAKIKDLKGDITENPSDIMETFPSFYSKLYSKANGEDPRNLDAFLEGIPLPTLTYSHRSLLESPISETKLLDIINGLCTGSTPGPDGFSNCYYKVFSHTLYGLVF